MSTIESVFDESQVQTSSIEVGDEPEDQGVTVPDVEHDDVSGPAESSPSTRGKGVLWGSLAVVVLLAVVAVAVVSGFMGGGDEERVIAGTFTLEDTDGFWSSSGICGGEGGYSDIENMAPVTVRDGTGAVIATGNLIGGFHDGQYCEFQFFIFDVPPDRDFYSIEVSHRGEIAYSREQLEETLTLGPEDVGWKVALTLGG